MEIRINGETSEISDHLETLTGVVKWICVQVNLQPDSIDIILVDDNTLRDLHKVYLHDDTFTDVMTFNLGENGAVEGEIYISITRAIAQSEQYKISLIQELIRLVIHGCLHLAGYNDQDRKERQRMKNIEDQFVADAFAKFLNF